jgi:peptide/nickel transport system substrate-binding protein
MMPIGPRRRGALLPSLAACVLVLGAGAADAALGEAPGLAGRVAAGELPAVEQRIPIAPEVIGDRESGRYGGTLRTALRGSNDGNGILRLLGAQGLTRWSVDFTTVLPNVAASWEVSADASQYIFHLRPGLKWSDGEPFTADDILFFAEDLLVNPEFYRAPPARYTIDGKPMRAEKLDDYTVRLSFAGPYGTFLQELATPLGQEPVLWAKHYCGQFVPKYNAQAADLAREAGASDWAAYFRQKCGDIELPTRWGNPARPTLDPWVMKEPYAGGATRVVAERNPYFWQLDQEGRQLPYLDRIAFGIAQDPESLLLETVAGKIDFQTRHVNTIANKPVLFENQRSGGYRLFRERNAQAAKSAIYLNLTHKDPTLRSILDNKDFRIALSLGINRPEIVTLIYLGESEPVQIGPRKGHPLYNERLSTQYTQYDPDEANSILDRLGFAKRDAEGFRLRLDGRRLTLTINTIPNLSPDHIDILEMVKRHWAKIGVAMTPNLLERAIFYQRVDADDFDGLIWGADGGLDMYQSPREVVAVHPQGSWYAIPWAVWYNTQGKAGEKPDDGMLRRLALWDEFKKTPDPAKQQALFRQIYELAADAFEVIGIATGADPYGVASMHLRNVPDGVMPESWSYGTPGPSLPQVYYFDNAPKS